MKDAIYQANIFQLFWSRNSMRSENVRAEWEYALSLGRAHFIRPTYWETPLPQSQEEGLPPEALRSLHFQHVRPVLSEHVSSDAEEVTQAINEREVTIEAGSSLGAEIQSRAEEEKQALEREDALR